MGLIDFGTMEVIGKGVFGKVHEGGYEQHLYERSLFTLCVMRRADPSFIYPRSIISSLTPGLSAMPSQNPTLWIK